MRRRLTKKSSTPLAAEPQNLFSWLMFEEIDKMRPAEEEDPNDFSEALRNVKAKRFLAKLQMEAEEQTEKGSRYDPTRKNKASKTYSPIPALADLRKLKSISQGEAADYLRRTSRTIRNYVSKKKLNVTPNKRVLCDDKLARLLRQTHGEAILH